MYLSQLLKCIVLHPGVYTHCLIVNQHSVCTAISIANEMELIAESTIEWHQKTINEAVNKSRWAIFLRCRKTRFKKPRNAKFLSLSSLWHSCHSWMPGGVPVRLRKGTDPVILRQSCVPNFGFVLRHTLALFYAKLWLCCMPKFGWLWRSFKANKASLMGGQGHCIKFNCVMLWL